MNVKLLTGTTAIFAVAVMLIGTTSCDDGKSYSDLLRDEEAAVNWYLAQNRVESRIPSDSVFEVGENAPFYRMTADGTVYMRVINAGNPEKRPETGQTVYFRYTLFDLKNMYEDIPQTGSGNIDNITSSGTGNNSFIFGNTVLPSTTRLGTGIQVPLKYLGYDCEVDLIVKSIDGISDNISQCVPYLYKGMKYFKAEY